MIPPSYQSGIRYVEGLTSRQMLEWVKDELLDEVHMLAGKQEDFPVQAIVNHYPYLSFKAQKGMDDAIDKLVFDWEKEHNEWPDSAVRALLSLVGKLPVPGAKYKLKALVESEMFTEIKSQLRYAVLCAIASLSTNEDRMFWNKIPERHQEYSGMTFQVLARIAPEDALNLLGHLPDNAPSIGGVARALPDFVSQKRPKKKQLEVLQRVEKAITRLSRKSTATLRTSLKEAGFEF